MMVVVVVVVVMLTILMMSMLQLGDAAGCGSKHAWCPWLQGVAASTRGAPGCPLPAACKRVQETAWRVQNDLAALAALAHSTQARYSQATCTG